MNLTEAIDTYIATRKIKPITDAELIAVARALGWKPPKPKPAEPVLPSDKAIQRLLDRLSGK